MSARKLPEELHNVPTVPENEEEVFSLEDILREFGAPQAAPEPQRGPEEEGKPAVHGKTAVETKPLQQPPPEEKKEQPHQGTDEPMRDKKTARPTPSPEGQYRIAQAGFGRRRARLVMSMLLSCGAAVLGFLRELGPLANYTHPGLLALGELAILVLCVVLTADVLFMGKNTPARQGAGFRLLFAFELLGAMAYGFLSLSAPSGVGFSAPMCMVLTCGLWGVQLRCRGMRDTWDAARKPGEKATLYREPDYYKGLPAFISGKESKGDFLKENGKLPSPQGVMDIYGLLVLVVSVLGASLSPAKDIRELLRNALLIALSGTPLLGLLAWARPWAILAERLAQRGAALYGWQGVKWAGRKLAVPIEDEDLFSTDNMKLGGIKFFGGAAPDRVVALGASVMSVAGSGLKNIFLQQAELRGVKVMEVTRFRRYEVGGVSGEIGSDSVLVGSLRFMQSMGVDMPSGTKVSQAVYVAVNGDLAGVFAIHYGISPGVAGAMAHITASPEVVPVITAGDFIVSESFLRSKFRVDTQRVVFPGLAQRAMLREKKCSDEGAACVLYGKGRLGVTALAVCGSRALLKAAHWGTAIAVLGGVLGLGVSVTLALLGLSLSVGSLLMYQLLWAIPLLLLGGWTKHI